MNGLYVIDTNGIIGYFEAVFHAPSALSTQARNLIARGFNSSGEIKLSIPSIVFVEIFEKWLVSEEMVYKFHYEVFDLVERSPNIEIKAVEEEVLENLLNIGGTLADHEIHDKIILASAMMLNCSIITTDPKIHEYVKINGGIPAVIS